MEGEFVRTCAVLIFCPDLFRYYNFITLNSVNLIRNEKGGLSNDWEVDDFGKVEAESHSFFKRFFFVFLR